MLHNQNLCSDPLLNFLQIFVPGTWHPYAERTEHIDTHARAANASNIYRGSIVIENSVGLRHVLYSAAFYPLQRHLPVDYCTLTLLLFFQGVACQACRTNSTVANMCQTGSVHGPVVTLDVTSGADGNFTSCSCFLQSNSSGFYFDFLSTPESPGCNAGLQLRFDDTSMQLLCGGLPGVQYTRGQSATIIYNMIDSTDAADSSYCLTFYNSKNTVYSLFFCN